MLAALEEARAKLAEQDELLKQLTTPPIGFATVLAAQKDLSSLIVASSSGMLEVERPPKLDIEAGDVVKVSPESGQITDVVDFAVPGDIVVVKRVIDDMIEADSEHGGTRLLYCNGRFSVEDGDRVVVDSTGCVIVRNLGKEESRYSQQANTSITWDSIGGLVEAKREMVEAIELPHRHPDLYKHYGKKPLKGVLLYGPPGCGKTMLGKAAATALANLHGAAASTGFHYVKGPEILDKYVGVAEGNIRSIFERTREHKAKHGYPAVVFIDEADAILGKRGSRISSDMESTIVPMFLAEMDGMDESGAVVILATNRPDVLDPAVVRDGRIDRKIKVTRPTVESAEEIFNLYLKGIPLREKKPALKEMATLGTQELFSSDRGLYTVMLHDGQMLPFTLAQVCNGGMIAGIVDQATSIAMQRDLAGEGKRGICPDDLVAAVDRVYRQNMELDHDDELMEFVHGFQDKVAGVHRLRKEKATA